MGLRKSKKLPVTGNIYRDFKKLQDGIEERKGLVKISLYTFMSKQIGIKKLKSYLNRGYVVEEINHCEAGEGEFTNVVLSPPKNN